MKRFGLVKKEWGTFRIRSYGLKIAGGIFLFVLVSQNSVISTLAPIREWVQTVRIYSPEVREELAHELALKEAELASRSRRLPQIRTSFQESFVQSSSDSGFLSTARVEIPLFQKAKPYYSWKMARLEREVYGTTRVKNQIERILRFRMAYYDAKSYREKLPKLLVERDLLHELIQRQSGMVIDKVKPLDQMEEVYRRWVLLDGTVQNTEAKLAVLMQEIAYLTDFNQNLSLDGRIPDPSHPLSEEEFEKQKKETLAHHPDIVMIQAEIEKQNAKLGLTKADWLPEISALSTYSRDPRFAGNENQLFGGVEVRWDIWDFGANHHEIKKEKSLLEELKEKSENQKQQIALKMEEAFRYYQAAYSVWKGTQGYLEFQEELLKSSERQYREGEVSWKDLAISRIHYLDQAVAFEDARADALKKEAQLSFALGLIDFNQKEITI